MKTKLDKSKHFDEVVGGGVGYKFFQDGHFYRGCGRECNEDGSLIDPTHEEHLGEVADLNRKDMLEKPLNLPVRFNSIPTVKQKRAKAKK